MGGCATKPKTLDGPHTEELPEEKQVVVQDAGFEAASDDVSKEVETEGVDKEGKGEEVTEPKADPVPEEENAKVDESVDQVLDSAENTEEKADVASEVVAQKPEEKVA